MQGHDFANRRRSSSERWSRFPGGSLLVQESPPNLFLQARFPSGLTKNLPVKKEESSCFRLSIRGDLIRIGGDAPPLGLSSRVEQSCFPSLFLTSKTEPTGNPAKFTWIVHPSSILY